jgi:hypothetical protein
LSVVTILRQTNPFLEIHLRLIKEPFPVPPMAEPRIFRVTSGEVVDEKRVVDSDLVVNVLTVGDFFFSHPVANALRHTLAHDQSRRISGKSISTCPLCISSSLPMTFSAALPRPSLALRNISGGNDKSLSPLLALMHKELTAGRKGP